MLAEFGTKLMADILQLLVAGLATGAIYAPKTVAKATRSRSQPAVVEVASIPEAELQLPAPVTAHEDQLPPPVEAHEAPLTSSDETWAPETETPAEPKAE